MIGFNASFRRGIHPPDAKVTADLPITNISPVVGTIMRYPMVQHIGEACTPTVSIGDYVLVGQKIGDTDANLSAPIHATVSGVVEDIKPAMSPRGGPFETIFVKNDGKLEATPTSNPASDYKTLSHSDIMSLIREAGIVGLGGAGFPTHIKLNPPKDKTIDTIIVNAAECEPYLTTDHRVLLEKTDEILVGLEVLLHIFPEVKGIVAIEDNKPDAIEKFKQTNNNSRIDVMPLKTKYPQGAEKQVIYACTTREVPSGGLPMDIGCIVQNVDTILAIHDAVILNRPLMRKVVTISGGAAASGGNFDVPFGMTFKDLVEISGGLKSEPHKIVVGGPLMGFAQSDLDVPIIKITQAVLLLTEKESVSQRTQNCCRCGKCVDHCPIGLVPLDLCRWALNNNSESFIKFNGLDCIICSCCSYVCPSHRDISHNIEVYRNSLRKKSM